MVIQVKMVVLNVLNDGCAEHRGQILSRATALSYIGGTERHQRHVQVQMLWIVPFRGRKLFQGVPRSSGDGQLGPGQNLTALVPLIKPFGLILAQNHIKNSTWIARTQSRQGVHGVTRPLALELQVIHHHVLHGRENLLAHRQSVNTGR